MKTTIAIAALVGLFAIGPASAQDMQCDKATMDKMNMDVNAMSAGGQMKEKKDSAMKHMQMAQESMAASKMDECMMHMNEANKAMQPS